MNILDKNGLKVTETLLHAVSSSDDANNTVIMNAITGFLTVTKRFHVALCIDNILVKFIFWLMLCILIFFFLTGISIRYMPDDCSFEV